jgi:hypothetical protein
MIMRFYSILLACLLPGMINAAGQAKHPLIEFEFLGKDLGNIIQGQRIREKFPFVNIGTGMLEITDIEKSWGCEAALLSAKQIPSGKNGQIEVTIDTGSLSGAVEKSVHVKTNDPNHPIVGLSIKAVVEPEIGISEQTIFFGRASQGKQITKEIEITLPPGKSLKILSARSEDPKVAVRLEPALETQYKLIALQKADAKPGYHFGKIIIKTNSRYSSEITIYESGEVTAPVRWLIQAF